MKLFRLFAFLFFLSLNQSYAMEKPDIPVCTPWPYCWDVRADPDGFIETSFDPSRPKSEDAIDVFDITQNSISFSCMRWRVAGMCVWYKWPYKIRTSVKVNHYIPDYVVSVYERSGENPWELMSFLDDIGDIGFEALVGFSSGGGSVKGKGRGEHSTNIMFKNVTAIGNPLASTWQTLGLGTLMCASEAQSFVPGYASSFDWLAWRTNPLEAALNFDQLITRRNRIKPSTRPTENWAFLYPRTGFVVGSDDAKTAAVAGLRASSILTDKSSLSINVANRPAQNSRSGYWPPRTVNIDNRSQGYFQMLLPKAEKTCRLISDMGSISEMSAYRSTNGNYAWNFWRPYTCCSGSGKLIANISW
ncbi:TIGR03756 family integrating conjugative element protein [Vibrio harveyi]|uniref:TIGR03756 family integrating conjugative element protein n=1 Tax=Vibrio harveyi TaxID=669 RepID=UPI001EFE5813|nr:TIGR03756 family integrating conjugative element protein [Vibrio harveyi]MCG9589951.1 TIGR03756 family integrating conjugative element protein [Vibrio harveyi]MCG9670354.1 TIGR03756 family integrating conjugative element protein [Vibrio harveyi]